MAKSKDLTGWSVKGHSVMRHEGPQHRVESMRCLKDPSETFIIELLELLAVTSG